MTDERKLARRVSYAISSADESYFLSKSGQRVNPNELSIMYVLDGGESYSQKQLAELLYMPLTTVNTIVKKWEKEGIITLAAIEGACRERHINLTERGKEYFSERLAFVYDAEEKALKATLEKYSPEFIDALEFYGKQLKCGFEKAGEQ